MLTLEVPIDRAELEAQDSVEDMPAGHIAASWSRQQKARPGLSPRRAFVRAQFVPPTLSRD
jgi:hypothetical protein